MPHILLIEDNEHQRRIMRERLQAEGYQVTDTPFGDEGLRMAKSQKPELLVIDIMVPHMNGWQVMEALQEDPTTKEIPFVVLSGAKVMAQDIERSMSMGAMAHFAKGVTPMDEMLQQVRHILGLKKVLVVDSNAQRAKEIRDILQRQRFLVSILSIGTDVVNRFGRIQPDAVVLTNQIVGMTSFVVMQRLRQLPGMDTLPIIILGDGTMPPISVKGALTTKALTYPCEEKVVVETLQELLGG
jgi:CheY-like chemotaxis protein